MKGPAAQLLWQRTFADAVTAVSVGTGPVVAIGVATGEIAYVSLADGHVRWKAKVHDAPVEQIALLTDGQAVSCGQDGAVWCTGATAEPACWLASTGWVEQVAVQEGTIWLGAGRQLWQMGADGSGQVRWQAPSTISGLAIVSRGVVVSHFGGLTTIPRNLDEPVEPLLWRGSLLGVAVSPNQRWFAAPSQEATLQIWPADGGQPLAMRGFPGRISALSWQMDSRVLVTACGADLTLWDFRGSGPDGKQPAALQIHDAGITTVVAHPLRTILLSADQTGLVVLTELGVARATVLGDIATRETVLGAAWSKDGRFFLVWTRHGTVGCWRL